MEYSSTGINNLKENKYKYPVIFLDHTCPECGKILILDMKVLKGNNIPVRYICPNCNFICPVYHNNENPNKLSPMYSASIANFIDSLGDTINNTRKKILI